VEPRFPYLARTDGSLHYAAEDLPVRLVALDLTVPTECKGAFYAAKNPNFDFVT
jgi:hypothetical protein